MHKEWINSAHKLNFWMVWRFDFLIKLLNKKKIKLKKSDKILDFGCGNGTLSNQLEGKFSVSIDRFDENKNILLLNKKVNGRLIFKKKQLPKNYYDYVFLFDVLEHNINDKQLIKNILKLMKKNSFLIINVPALNIFFSKYDSAVGHVKRYTKSSFLKCTNIKNYKLINCYYWGILLLPFLILRKINSFYLKKKNKKKIIQNGFSVNNFNNKILLLLKRIELNLFTNMILGTSLMVVMKKK